MYQVFLLPAFVYFYAFLECFNFSRVTEEKYSRTKDRIFLSVTPHSRTTPHIAITLPLERLLRTLRRCIKHRRERHYNQAYILYQLRKHRLFISICFALINLNR